MKACPNAQCPHRLQWGTPAPYLPAAVLCRHCASRVVPIEHLERAARHATTMPAVRLERGFKPAEGTLFFVGLAIVVIPHILAHFIGNIAYALPVLAVAYGLSRIPRRPAPARTPARARFDTTGVRPLPLRLPTP